MNIKNIFKISIILIILLVSIGSIYASEDFDDSSVDEDDFGVYEDDMDLDEELDDDLDDFDFDEDDVDLDDDEFDDYDWDDFDDELWDDYDWDDEVEFEDDYTDFDYLTFKVYCYLERYGNSSDDWINSQEFLDEYLIYQTSPNDYKLNESLEGYETYLKIFNSINSTLKDYNLTENETEYIYFMIIYYLNHFGNVSANYTWNESDEFENFIPFLPDILCAVWRKGSAPLQDFNHYLNINSHVVYKDSLAHTSNVETVSVNVPFELSWWNILIITILLIVFVIL